MKVYLTPPQPSLGLERIATALRRYAPPSATIHTFPNISNNDLTVIYAIGRRNAIEQQCEKILKAGKRYAIIQVCLRSTMAPDSGDWLSIWNNAAAVWSYYDLEKALSDDGWEAFGVHKPTVLDNFYHAPLGADANVFKLDHSANYVRDYIILSSGLSRLSESVRECHLAAQAAGMMSAHLGTEKSLGNGTHCYNSVDDKTLAWLYNSSHFVSGLRRTEGFELPAVEGLLCGSRPICFDTYDYHWNYGDHAEYIKEGTRQEVVDQLVELFKHGARGVTEEERADAVERFNWETIIGGFYERIL